MKNPFSYRVRATAMCIACLAIGLAAAKPPLNTTAPAQAGKKPDLHRLSAIMNDVRSDATDQHDAWFNDGDFPRSIQSLRVLHELFPSDYQLLTDLGWMLENVENYGAALAVYIDYAHTFPEDPEAAYPEAEFYFRNHLYSKVPRIIEPTLRMKSHPHPNSYRILARCYEKLGLFEDAKRVWDGYLALAPEDGQAKVNQARVTKKLRAALQTPKPRDS